MNGLTKEADITKDEVVVEQRTKLVWRILGRRKADKVRTIFWLMVIEAAVLFVVGIYIGQ